MSVMDDYNRYVSYVQGYFRGDPLTSEEQYNVYSLLYDLHIPTKGNNKDLLDYMKRHDLSWNDLNFKKTVKYFGNGTVESSLGALNFVSHNVSRLYR